MSEEGTSIFLSDFLVFCTGSDCQPPLGFSKDPEIQFLHRDGLPTASTCDLVFRLPTGWDTYAMFREKVIEALLSNKVLGQA